MTSDNEIPFGSMLAEGYAFQYSATGEFVEYTKAAQYSGDNAIYNVKVVKCPHKKIENGTCAYCGKTGIVATIGSTVYTDIAAAVTDWLANGGTLTLHADGGLNAVDFGREGAAEKSLTIDLNGHRINCDDYSSGTEVKLSGFMLTIRD